MLCKDHPCVLPYTLSVRYHNNLPMPVLLPRNSGCLLLSSCYSLVIPPRLRSRTLHQYFRVPPALWFFSMLLFYNFGPSTFTSALENFRIRICYSFYYLFSINITVSVLYRHVFVHLHFHMP
jgi:hypothetical protein